MIKPRLFYSMWLLAVSVALASLAGLALAVAPVLAAGPVVNTGGDENDGSCTDGDCSLRDAITTALDGETITFAGDYTIYLTNPLTISNHLTVDGSNRAITISGDTNNDGSPNVWIFSINSSGVATITHLSIVSGTAPMPLSGSGGGILNNQGTVTVQNSTLSGNSADYFGGGIMNNKGTITVRHSTFSGNSAGNGANYTGGGIMNQEGTLTVQNSTFSGNVARVNSLGGGILNNNGTVTVQNSTFSGNSAGAGGGIRNWGTLVVTNSTFSGNLASLVGAGIAHDYSGGLLMSMSNTIIANSSSGGDCYSYNPVTPNNYNLIEDGSCSPFLSGDPQLSLFPADNGGPTWTFALSPGSPAIDQGSNAACLSADQRGVPRPQGGVCDIGAFEVAQPKMAVLGGSPLTLITNGATLPTPTNHTDFGSTVRVGGQMTHTFTISNTGAYTLSVTSLSLSGANAADFTVSGIAPPTTASPGSSVSFNVTFAPQVIGTRVATVTIANDDSDENPYGFAIQGTVTQDLYLPLIVKD